ncbi:hypothetical protein [Methylocystis sp. ATCC 49242]|uniref:hypothetical protein n=1 Tax=Methylocystis sp. ATCC 49242 TaxID=622637 RepID=UPI0001F875EB|nr:hypothetical protein [Methylocystis sp. ATCC 49242]
MGDDMPHGAVYRGCAIHRFQSEDRIRQIVIPAIDAVSAMEDPDELFAYLTDVYRPPEARLLAKRKLLDPADEARAAGRKAMVDVALVRAWAAGLDSLRWASPQFYGTDLTPGLPPGSPPLPARPAEHAEALRAAQKLSS